MQISTVARHTAGANTLLCRSAAAEASKLPSFNTTGRCLGKLPSGFSTPPPQVILALLCPSDEFILGLTRIPTTPSRFQYVQNRDISLHSGGAKTSADRLICMHASCIFMSSHVCTSESPWVLEVFQVLARRVVQARCAQHVLPEVMISPKDLIWTGGTFDPGSIRG